MGLTFGGDVGFGAAEIKKPVTKINDTPKQIKDKHKE